MGAKTKVLRLYFCSVYKSKESLSFCLSDYLHNCSSDPLHAWWTQGSAVLSVKLTVSAVLQKSEKHRPAEPESLRRSRTTVLELHMHELQTYHMHAQV